MCFLIDAYLLVTFILLQLRIVMIVQILYIIKLR